jgi:hypothetical protein
VEVVDPHCEVLIDGVWVSAVVINAMPWTCGLDYLVQVDGETRNRQFAHWDIGYTIRSKSSNPDALCLRGNNGA